jgi:hypothetical protein
VTTTAPQVGTVFDNAAPPSPCEVQVRGLVALILCAVTDRAS